MRVFPSLSSCCVRILLLSAGITGLTTAPELALAAPGDTELISVLPATGRAASGESPAISPDGRYVVYSAGGIFLRDRLAGTTERIDVGLNDEEPNEASYYPDVTPDGRFVAFQSAATNLVHGETAPYTFDIFVRDRQAGITEQVNIGLRGEEANAECHFPRISADGRFVAFLTSASNLVVGDTNEARDIFMRDRLTGITERVTIGSDGQPADIDSSEVFGISEDGRYIAFLSNANNLVPGFSYDGQSHIFVRDRWLATNEPISALPSGQEGFGNSTNPEISASGRFVVFAYNYADLDPRASYEWEIYLRDRDTGVIERQSVNAAGAGENGQSWTPGVSADGRYVVFQSEASNLVPGDTNGVADIFVRDRVTRQIQRVNVTSTGLQSTGYVDRPKISADGRFVVFATTASLSPADTNGTLDVYLHEMSWQPMGTYAYTVSPRAVVFGKQTLTSSSTRRFWLTNTGTVPLPIFSVKMSGENRWAFRVSHNCAPWVPVGTTCAIKVTYRPTWAGAYSAVVRIVAGDRPVGRVVTGTGVVSAFGLSPTALNFGSVPINTTSPAQKVTITNTGEGVLPLESMILDGANKYQFTRYSNCPSNVAVGANCTATVRFKPTSVGVKRTQLQVSAAGGAGSKSVALSGTGH